jgi:class 3 adenylate cyclase
MMFCPACNAENRDDRRFCAKCGTVLPAVCKACGFANDVKDDFCGGCGAPLKHADRPSEKPGDAAIAQGDRRQVTILFADLVGFTKLTGELGAEATHGILNRYLSIVDEIATGHGGSVEYIGDAVMALFGAPIAHSDDPLRAVRAAGEIHQAMPSLGAEFGRVLQTHIGVASGEVIAAGLGRDGKAKYTVIGDSVNLAARLDGLASAGETLISDAVQRAVSRQFDCQSAGEVTVKGFEQPVKVWRVVGEAATSGPRFDTPFVGRQAELRQFAGIADVCRETGAGRVIVLRGEAGIGKTRLADAFTTATAELGFQCHPRAGSGLRRRQGPGRDPCPGAQPLGHSARREQGPSNGRRRRGHPCRPDFGGPADLSQ